MDEYQTISSIPSEFIKIPKTPCKIKSVNFTGKDYGTTTLKPNDGSYHFFVTNDLEYINNHLDKIQLTRIRDIVVTYKDDKREVYSIDDITQQ